jgi:hypothetical protein
MLLASYFDDSFGLLSTNYQVFYTTLSRGRQAQLARFYPLIPSKVKSLLP